MSTSDAIATTAPGIHKKMLRLMETVGGIAKDKSGVGINYKFRGIDDLYAQLHPALRSVGVAMYPIVVPGTMKVDQREGTRGNGKSFVQTSVTFSLQVTFVDVEDGSTAFVVVPAQGVDDSDKSAGKAMSYGMKNALFHALAIPTEDPDAERPEVITDEKTKRKYTKKTSDDAPAAATTEEAPKPLQGTEASDALLTARINAATSEAELNELIDSELRKLPPDRQLALAKVCKERRTKGF